jgi:predicted permease
MNKPNFDSIVTFVCCLIIALGLNDIFFANKIIDGIVSVIAGSILMPGVMTWDFGKANKYQKVFLAGIAIMNTGLIGYLVYRFLVR